ncbi:hypothetical protein [Sphingobacterium sp. IITKGP-BTPF85]|nr:hypothetical protein [Sphingobacterium sp. IITKGP-BTPF85]KKX52109.1 hypothetical protein L950_0201025 [Sphingobacterium sp. IITKGP-BTPF85]
MTTRKQLYEINAKNPNLLPIYIGLMEKQQNYLDYRQHLRDLPNIDKYPFLLEKYPNITKYVTQIELAQFMGMSREYLRQQQRNYD